MGRKCQSGLGMAHAQHRRKTGGKEKKKPPEIGVAEGGEQWSVGAPAGVGRLGGC